MGHLAEIDTQQRVDALRFFRSYILQDPDGETELGASAARWADHLSFSLYGKINAQQVCEEGLNV